MDITITPIGVVKNSITKPGLNNWKEIVSEIEIDRSYEQALDQLDDFSHIIVLFWMNHAPAKKRALVKIHPRGRQDLPLVGVFATRSPMRPNPIGITTVKLLKINEIF